MCITDKIDLWRTIYPPILVNIVFECPLRLIQILGKKTIPDIFDKCTSARAVAQAICNADQSSMIFHLPDKHTYVSVIPTFYIAYGLIYCMLISTRQCKVRYSVPTCTFFKCKKWGQSCVNYSPFNLILLGRTFSFVLHCLCYMFKGL